MAGGGEDGHGNPAELSRRAQGLLTAGRPAEAAELLHRAVEGHWNPGRDGLHGRADAWRLLGTALRESGEVEGSVQALEQAVSLLENASRGVEEDFLLAVALRSLAVSHDLAEELRAAERARAEALEIAGTLLPALPDHAAELGLALARDLEATGRADWTHPLARLTERSADLADETALRVLHQLHGFWMARDDADAAGRIVHQGVERVRGMEDAALPEGFAAVHNLAWSAVRSDLPDPAGELVARLEGIAGSLDPDQAHALRRLDASLTLRFGDEEEALEKLRAAHAWALETFGDDDPRTRRSQRDLADGLDGTGRGAQASEVYREALERELRLGDDPLGAAEIATALGRELDGAFDFAPAQEMHRLALGIRRRTLGPNHSATRSSLYEVAELSRVLGRAEEAELFFLEALDAEREEGGPATEREALIRNNLADLYIDLGRFDEARPLVEEALEIRRRIYGEESDRAWRSRRTLATWERDGGDPERAVALARAALDRPDAASGASWYLLLAGALLRVGGHQEAEDLYGRLLEAVAGEKVGRAVSWGAYLEMVEGLCLCRMAREDWSEAVEAAARVVETALFTVPELARDASEMKLTRLLRGLTDVQSLLLRALARTDAVEPETVESAFELVQLTKGLRTRYLRWRQPGVANVDWAAPPGHDRADREARGEMRHLHEELVRGYLSADEPAAFTRSRDALASRARLRELERKLARGITDWETMLDDGPVLRESLLPDGAMAVEVVVARDVATERAGGTAPAHRYMALVLGPEDPTDPELVDLGLAADLDEAVAGLRDSLMGEAWTEGAPDPDWVRLRGFLARKILDPIRNRVASAEHLLVAPDGALGAFPFELLETAEGGFLLDDVTLSYLMRTGDLVHRREAFRIDHGPLVLAGPDFDLPGAFAGTRSGQAGADRLFRLPLAGDRRFQPLPEARREGAAVAELLGVEPLLGPWALAPELLGSDAPEILHVSTHGFCLPFEGAANESLALADPLGNALDRRMVLEDSLQRSGLALSGVNAVLDGRAIPPEAGEGLAYAAEIQQMNLQRTDLVVLTACRSGLGDLEVGDGAHGLRRAFLAAGARSVVSALWDIPETSSRKMMEGFYRRLLEGAGRLEALAEARAAVRAEHPRDPVHWAGLVLDGAFDPLWRFSGLGDLKVASLNLADWGLGGVEAEEAREEEDGRDPVERAARWIVEGAEDGPGEGRAPGVAALRAVLADDGADPDERIGALSGLGDLANRLGEHEEAVERYQAILDMPDLSPEHRATYGYNVAKILHQAGRLDAAVARYGDLLAAAPDDRLRFMARVNRGVALLELGRTDEAAADFTAVVDDPEAPPDQRFMAHSGRAEARKEAAPDRALEDVDAALAAGVADEVERFRLRLGRARLLVETGRSEEALAEIGALKQAVLPGTAGISPGVRAELDRLRAQARGG